MMKIYRRLQDVPAKLRRTAVLGNFDGVHRGHQSLIQAARELQGSILLLTFHPHPQDFMGRPFGKIQTLEEKLSCLDSYGVDEVLILPFDQALADMSKDDFLQQILCDALGAEAVVVGYNYHFGKGAQGKSSDIPALGKKYGFQGIVVPACRIDEKVVSSSRIREAIRRGHIQEAEKLLGHPYEVHGIVVHGQGVGRTIGFPTANLEVSPDKLLPGPGVYSVLGRLDDRVLPGFCNVGTQPTFRDRERQLVVEAHFFDFEEDLYGQKIALTFVSWLRKTQRFPSVADLVEELKADRTAAKAAIQDKSHAGTCNL